MDAKKKTIRNWLAVIVTVVFFAFQMYHRKTSCGKLSACQLG